MNLKMEELLLVKNGRRNEMSIPIEGVGVGVVSGGAVVVFVMKMLPILLRRINGKKTNNRSNAKPGTAKICRDRGEKIVEHDVVIGHLCELSEKAEEQAETARKENREDHKDMMKKVD